MSERAFCVWCGAELRQSKKGGGRRLFCNPIHRKAAHRFKQRYPEVESVWGRPLVITAQALKELEGNDT